MRVIDVGVQPVGFVAIGQLPTGVIAIGQGATGVIAIGQLARGVLVLGQLAIGVVAFGQLAVGLGWAGGMLAIAPVSGPYMLGTGLFGALPFSALRRGQWSRFVAKRMSPRGLGVRLAVLALIAAATWVVALAPLLDDLTRVGGVFREPPRQLR
ncbi:MAG: hypothetical protein ACRDZZ_15720 [Ilumatobacteraceae bacterium]